DAREGLSSRQHLRHSRRSLMVSLAGFAAPAQRWRPAHSEQSAPALLSGKAVTFMANSSRPSRSDASSAQGIPLGFRLDEQLLLKQTESRLLLVYRCSSATRPLVRGIF